MCSGMRCVHIVVCAKAACGEVGVRFRRQAVLTRVGIRGSIVVTSNPMRMMGVKSGGTSRGASISPICQKGGEKPSQGKEALGVYVCICVPMSAAPMLPLPALPFLCPVSLHGFPNVPVHPSSSGPPEVRMCRGPSLHPLPPARAGTGA